MRLYVSSSIYTHIVIINYGCVMVVKVLTNEKSRIWNREEQTRMFCCPDRGVNLSDLLFRA